MPSTLPPPASGVTGATDEQVKYVVASSGHAAHPDDIAASCRALQAHVVRARDDAERTLQDLAERELAEKRRVAPGWLDSEARLLEPERTKGEVVAVPAAQLAEMSLAERRDSGAISEMAVDQGEELDRAFGGWK